MFKATTNLFGNSDLVFERKMNEPMFSVAKKGTDVKTRELLGSNPVQHEIKKGNNF